WKTLGYARRFRSVIVNYADDCVVLGKAVDGIRDSGHADDGHVDNDETETDDEGSHDPHTIACVRCPGWSGGTVHGPWVSHRTHRPQAGNRRHDRHRFGLCITTTRTSRLSRFHRGSYEADANTPARPVDACVAHFSTSTRRPHINGRSSRTLPAS
ncbi:MAG: hypothetical protein OXC68_14190, partial [Aestuariivita sp.]|nr:hypothetical protein [Aestuariivita sp.]